MDLEGFAKRGLRRADPDVKSKLTNIILEVKKERIRKDQAERLAHAVMVEAVATLEPQGEIFELQDSGVHMGEFGIGSRGLGDFYAHSKIAEVIGETDAKVDSRQLDDSGAIEAGGKYLILTVDGMHSRLSDYPFLAGFHVARATLRDVYVMGAKPVAMLSDIHLADDGDVSRLFDHIAGIAAVGDLTGAPLITGSTLRIGGDMVIGDRLTGCVGAVGVSDDLTPRRDAAPGDVILMTEGAGGGTICAAALYYGWHQVVDETINIKFLEAASALIDANLEIHAMTDVTNGGIRGDAKEISYTAGVKLVFEEEMMRSLVNSKVQEMLETLEIDYLGVSIDALLIIAPQTSAEEIAKVIKGVGVKINQIGRVEEGTGVELHTSDGVTNFEPRFRESAYTPIKKVVDKEPTRNFEDMKEQVNLAAQRAVAKKNHFVNKIRKEQTYFD
ncbi:MAG: AIR synthase-related protein [Methanotrichaceae archaeon]